MHRCEVFETSPKIIRGVDCGGYLGYFVFVAVLAYAIFGHLVGHVLVLLRSRRGGMETAIDSNVQDIIKN